MGYKPTIVPYTNKIAVSHQTNLGVANYDLRELYSPDSAVWRSKFLDLGSPKYSPNKTYWFDRSRYKNNCTISGAVWKQLSSGLWALSFDATDDNITFGDTSTLAWMHGKGNTSAFKWTYAVWFNQVHPGTANAPILDTCAAASANTGISIFTDTNRKIRVIISKGSSGNSVINLTSTNAYPNSTAFNCLIVTYDQSLASANLNLYLAGAWLESADKTVNAPNDANASYAPLIGRFNTPTGAFDGTIGEMLILNGVVFTAAQVSQYYLADRWRYN